MTQLFPEASYHALLDQMLDIAQGKAKGEIASFAEFFHGVLREFHALKALMTRVEEGIETVERHTPDYVHTMPLVDDLKFDQWSVITTKSEE